MVVLAGAVVNLLSNVCCIMSNVQSPFCARGNWVKCSANLSLCCKWGHCIWEINGLNEVHVSKRTSLIIIIWRSAFLCHPFTINRYPKARLYATLYGSQEIAYLSAIGGISKCFLQDVLHKCIKING